MGDDHDGLAGVAPGEDLLPEVEVGALVEALVRLVEQGQVGGVQLAQDEVELLPGAAGELLGELVGGRAPGRGAGQVLAGGAGTPGGQASRGAEEREVLAGREPAGGAAVLRYEPDPAGALHGAAAGADQAGAD